MKFSADTEIVMYLADETVPQIVEVMNTIDHIDEIGHGTGDVRETDT